MTGDGCGCQNVVEVVGNAWVEDDGIDCGCHDRVRVAGSARVEDDSDNVDGDRGETRRWVAGPVLDRTRGQLLTRPAGLLRTVGRTSLNELYVLVRFKLLDK